MATANWNPLGDEYYRKTEIYTMDWIINGNVDLSKNRVAAAPFAGPIALIRDDSKVGRVSTTKPIVYIYNAAGREISHMRWNSGNLIQIGWSNTEDLLCIQDDGVVLVYNMFCTFKKTFSMGDEAKTLKVKDCKVFQGFHGTGIAIITNSLRVFIVNNVEDSRIRRLAEVPGLQPTFRSWIILTVDRQTKAMVANGSELVQIDQGGQFEVKPFPPPNWSEGNVIDMALSSDRKSIALYTSSGLIWVGTSDLKTKLWEFDTKGAPKPLSFLWCGNSAVVCHWDTLMLVIGPDKNHISYMLDGPVYLVEEVDGVRIIGNMQHEFLEKVPDVTLDVYKILSLAPGAMLRQASKEYLNGSQKADEHLRMIENKDVAVDQCILAAGHQFEPTEQKELLKAAAFGKSFITEYSPKRFVTMCQTLRVLNQIRHFSIGIPLTYTQLEQLSKEVLIDRLVLRMKFLLAIRICQFLHIPDAEGVSRILAHWACYKVQQKYESDEAVAHAISQKLGDTPGVSYSEIACKATECGRDELAIKLLEFEPKASEQVPLLMKMNRNELALSKAISSGDTDLVYTVLLKLQDSNSSDFPRQIRNMPMAYFLYLQYCRKQNRKELQNMYYTEDNYLEDGLCHVIDSFNYERLEDRMCALKDAVIRFTKSKNEFITKQTEEQIKLLDMQQKFEEEYNKHYIDLTLHETIHQLIVDDKMKQAELLRKTFKVPDRRFWWLKINALAKSGLWEELDKFSKTKKPPVGMEAFVDVCMKHKNPDEARKYIPRVHPENKVRCLLKTGLLKEAADLAFENRNEDELNIILSKCSTSNPTLMERIKGLKAQLSSKK
ncbi:vacuolar protein sorting-associated protein 16 homolog [Argonauta hians]